MPHRLMFSPLAPACSCSLVPGSWLLKLLTLGPGPGRRHCSTLASFSALAHPRGWVPPGR
eukprot:878940-Alexandrium_andersonii.AAC.1